MRQVSPDGPDLIVDLVGGDTLRAVADLVPDRTRIISPAGPETAAELGGLPLARTDEAMGKITDVIKYGLVDPHAAPARLSELERGKRPDLLLTIAYRHWLTAG